MVAEFGISALARSFGQARRPRSQSLLDAVESETNAIIAAQLKRACEIVAARREEIALLSAGLMERDTLDSDEIKACFGLQGARAAA